MLLQQDTLSRRAAILLPVLDEIAIDGRDTEHALLRAWSRRVDADSRAAALFELWFAELSIATWHAMIPAEHRDVARMLHPHVMMALITGTDPALRSRRRGIAAQAFATAAGADVPGGPSGGATVMARWWQSITSPVVENWPAPYVSLSGPLA